MFLEKERTWVQDIDIRFFRSSKGKYEFYINKHNFQIYLTFKGDCRLISDGDSLNLEKAKQFCEEYQLPNP